MGEYKERKRIREKGANKSILVHWLPTSAFAKLLVLAGGQWGCKVKYFSPKCLAFNLCQKVQNCVLLELTTSTTLKVQSVGQGFCSIKRLLVKSYSNYLTFP